MQQDRQSFRILLVEDADSFRESVKQILGVYSDVDGVANLEAARKALKKNSMK